MKNCIRVLQYTFLFTSLIFSQSISWQQLSGPHGGSIYSIVHDSDGNIYANAFGNVGPYKSTDDGESWFAIANGLTPGDNGGYHPLNINSSGDLFIGGAHPSARLCRSTDGGNLWEPLNNLNTTGGSILCISFDANEYVYVGTGTGIYRSTDNGESWNIYGFSGSGVEAVVFNDSGHVFAGNSGGVSRSTDNGASWTPLPTGGGTRTLAIAANGYIFAGCWENGGIIRSTDNGNIWTYSYPQTTSVYGASTVLFDVNGDIYFPTHGKGVLKSTDNGDNWIEMNNGIGYNYIRAIAKNSTGSLLAGGGYAIYKSRNDGSSWYSVGLPVCGVKDIVISPADYIFAAVWGVNRSTDGGQSWQTINNGFVNLDIRALAVKDNGYLFAGTNDSQDGTVFRSTDNGENWIRIDNFPTGIAINGLAVGPAGEIIVTASGYHLICKKSTDDGTTWQDIRYNINFGPGKVAINSVGDIFITGGSQLWRKLAADTVWTVCSGSGCGSPPAIFIASNGYIYTDYTKSTDNGDTWITNNFPTFISSYAENSLGHLFISTFNSGQGIYRSTDYAETWEQINDGLPIMDIRSVGVDALDYLYAGSWGMSMFKTTTSTLVSVDHIEFKPTHFSLEQNYPNPFNPSTVISYQLPVSSDLTLKIYDVLGNEVATLVNEYEVAGRYDIEFNASSLPSGVYFYQIKAGEFLSTKKMILLR